METHTVVAMGIGFVVDIGFVTGILNIDSLVANRVRAFDVIRGLAEAAPGAGDGEGVKV